MRMTRRGCGRGWSSLRGVPPPPLPTRASFLGTRERAAALTWFCWSEDSAHPKTSALWVFISPGGWSLSQLLCEVTAASTPLAATPGLIGWEGGAGAAFKVSAPRPLLILRSSEHFYEFSMYKSGPRAAFESRAKREFN